MASTEASITAVPSRGRLDKRRAILDAAMRVFAREGYAQSSIDVIAAEAGVAKPTIYNHLGGKENLFRAVMIETALRTTSRTLKAIEELPAEPGDVRQELVAVAKRMVDCMRDEQAWALRRLLEAEVTRFPDLFEAVLDTGATRIMDALAGRLARLANSGYLDLDNPVRAANQFVALITDQLVRMSAVGTRPLDESTIDEVVRGGADTFLRAFALVEGLRRSGLKVIT